MAEMLDQGRATELVHEIGSMVVNSERYRARPWESLSIVVVIDGSSVQLSGYTYGADGKPQAGNPGNFDINDKFEELQEAMAGADQRRWKSALLQINRDGGKLNIDFEYDDPLRWKVTPTNVDTKPHELRPK
jgi:hypothetical protein